MPSSERSCRSRSAHHLKRSHFVRSGQSIGHGKTGNTRADDANIRGVVGAERLQRLTWRRCLPEGDVRTCPARGRYSDPLPYLRNSSDEQLHQVTDSDAFLLHRIAFAQRHGIARFLAFLPERIEIKFVTPKGVPISSWRRVPPPDRTGFIIEDMHVRAQEVYHFSRFCHGHQDRARVHRTAQDPRALSLVSRRHARARWR